MAVNPIPMVSEGVVFASLSKQAKNRVIQEIGKRAARLFEVKRDAIVNALDFREMVSQDRHEFYKGRSVQEWADLKQTFPEEYSKQIRDFYILERRISSAQNKKLDKGGQDAQVESTGV